MPPTQPDPWPVICYEVRMFRLARDLRKKHGANVDLKDVFVEAELLHVRNLAEAISCVGGQSDDIKLSEVLALRMTPWLAAAMCDLTKQYTQSAPSASSPKNEINKRLAHMTKKRAAQIGYDYGPLFSVMEPAIERVISEMEKIRSPLCPPAASGTIALANATSTSSTSGNR